MKCEKCGKEIPDGESKICDECKKNLLNDLSEETSKEKEKCKCKISKCKFIKPVVIMLIVAVIIALLIIGYIKETKITDIVDDIVSSKNSEGNTISNIRNYGYIAKQGSWYYYIAASEDASTPAIYKSKRDGSSKTLLYENKEKANGKGTENVIGLNAYKDYLYFIVIDDESVVSDEKLTDTENTDLVNNKICRMKLDGTDFQVINNNEMNNNCYEIYVVDDKVYYIGVDTNIYYMDLNGENKTKLNNDETGYLGITKDYIILNVKKEADAKEENADDITYETKIMNRDGSNLHSLTGERLYSVSIIGDYVYYTNEKKAIYKVKIDGSDNKLISDSATAYNMNVTNKYIYFMNYIDGKEENPIGVYRMDLDGNNNTLIYTFENYSSFLNVVCDKVGFMDSSDKEATINLINSKGENRVKLYTLDYEKMSATQTEVENKSNVEENTVVEEK